MKANQTKEGNVKDYELIEILNQDFVDRWGIVPDQKWTRKLIEKVRDYDDNASAADREDLLARIEDLHRFPGGATDSVIAREIYDTCKAHFQRPEPVDPDSDEQIINLHAALRAVTATLKERDAKLAEMKRPVPVADEGELRKQIRDIREETSIEDNGLIVKACREFYEAHFSRKLEGEKWWTNIYRRDGDHPWSGRLYPTKKECKNGASTDGYIGTVPVRIPRQETPRQALVSKLRKTDFNAEPRYAMGVISEAIEMMETMANEIENQAERIADFENVYPMAVSACCRLYEKLVEANKRIKELEGQLSAKRALHSGETG